MCLILIYMFRLNILLCCYVQKFTLVMSAEMYVGICVKLSLKQSYVNENLSKPTKG